MKYQQTKTTNATYEQLLKPGTNSLPSRTVPHWEFLIRQRENPRYDLQARGSKTHARKAKQGRLSLDA